MADDLRSLAADLRGAGEKAARGARLATEKSIADVTAEAKRISPYRYGTLRASIGYDVTESGGTIRGEAGPTVDYGLYQEVGTSVMSPQPYMGPAFDRYVDAYERALQQVAEDGGAT